MKRQINSLDEVDATEIKTYYNYNGVDFYYRKRTDDDRLIVSFHGALPSSKPTQLPLFRVYNCNYNILCISDNLLEKYPGLLLGWFCTEKGSNVDVIYKEIIGFFISKHTRLAASRGFCKLEICGIYK